MADISKIQIGTTAYNIVDETARLVSSTTQNGLMTAAQKAKLDGATDYIVDQGTSRITTNSTNGWVIDWEWRKWNSGIAECWGRYENLQSTSNWWLDGNKWYFRAEVPLPFTMTTFDSCIINTNWSGYAITDCPGSEEVNSENGYEYHWKQKVVYIFYEQDGAYGIDKAHMVHIHYFGRWK